MKAVVVVDLVLRCQGIFVNLLCLEIGVWSVVMSGS